MVIGGIGVALRSGALETWFFNNYKMLVSDADPERKIFGFFSARVRIISNWVAMATGVFIGSNIVFYFSLSFAFKLNSFNYFLFFLFILFFLNNYKDENNKEMNNHESVIKIFYSSIIYIFNHKPLLVYIIGY